VDTITEDEAAASVVAMLVRLARDLRMTVVAEGIETPDQIQALIACGVEEGQGYVVSPPLQFANFDELLQIRRSRALAEKIVRQAALVA
jgi:EAL domain-containing protein (putative c-di-GMP-specific phosphodiesterase class I)